MDQDKSEARRGAAGAAAADPLDDLEQQLAALTAEIDTLDAAIKAKQGTLTSTQSDLDQQRARKQARDKRRSDLQRLVDTARDQRQKLDQQRQDAESERSAAAGWLQQVQADLAQQLAKDLRDKIDKAIAAVDQAAKELDEKRTAKQEELAAAEADLAAKKVAAQQADEARAQAQAALGRLIVDIRDALAWVKRAQAAVKKAYDAGQSREAYLLADDLKRALQQLAAVLDPKRETELAQQMKDAWAAAQKAADALTAAEDLLKQRRGELADLDKQVQAYRDGRRQKIEEQLAPAPAPVPAPAAAVEAAGPVNA
jgi:chromosome segregation ATPase